MDDAHAALLADVARHLTARGPWSFVARTRDSEPELLLVSAEGAAISVNFDGWRSGKVTVSATYPTDAAGQIHWPSPEERAPSINISYGKGAEWIAAQLERRFLPGYLAAWDRAVADATHDDYAARQRANIQRIARATDGHPREPAHRGTGAHSDLTWPNEDRQRGYVRSAEVRDEYVTLELRHVPVDTAIAIINLLHRKDT